MVKPTVQYVKHSQTVWLWIIRVTVTRWGPCQTSHQTRGVTLSPVPRFPQKVAILLPHLVSNVSRLTLHFNRLLTLNIFIILLLYILNYIIIISIEI